MKRWAPLVLLVCLAGFGWGLFRLFQLRFEAGDVYAEYSSLRADPLGTMALAESLERIRSLNVQRDFSEEGLLPDGPSTSYLHLAARAREWEALPVETAVDVERFLKRGGRLVVTFFPETSSLAYKTIAGARRRAVPLPSRQGAAEREKTVSLKDRWGLEFDFVRLELSDRRTYVPAAVRNLTELKLPDALEWHSGLVFTNLGKTWQAIYARGPHPVLVQRQFGPGTLLLATDSFFLSNEALRNDRHADLLAWLVGSSRTVIFDEAHLGVVETKGVSSLLRKYRLQWGVAALGLLAALFIWKNSVSFVPPRPQPARVDFIAGKDASSGFVNLLRRNISRRDLLNVCFAEWTKSLLHGNTHSIRRVDQAQAALEAENARPPSQRDPVAMYRSLCEILKPNKG